MLKRRNLLQAVLSFAAWLPIGRKAAARSALSEAQADRFRAIASVVLPEEIGADGQARAVDQFLNWLREYRAAAQTDHGYGVTRTGTTPASPAAGYSAQFADLDRRTDGDFTAAARETRRQAVAAAVEEAGIRTLPERPDGGHVATDLMAHFFNGADANDLAYGRLIGRFSCRGLAGSQNRPPLLSRPGPAT
jgi:hypothetical protein